MKNRKIFLSTLLTFLFVSEINAEKISSIVYNGNIRIDDDTIESYLPVQVGEDCDADLVNETIKTLISTGFFEDVKAELKGNKLIITVKEYPMINKIIYKGNSKVADRDIDKVIEIKQRNTLSPIKLKEAVQKMKQVYKTLGRYNANVEYKIKELSENRVDLTFEINEGDPAKIRAIEFSGNKQISSSDLRDAIYSKVNRWYRFFATDDVYDEDRLDEDKIALARYYHDSGYAHAKVVSGEAVLADNMKSATLKFVIEEGPLFKIGNVSVVSHIGKLKSSDLDKDLATKKGNKYSKTIQEFDINSIIRLASVKGYSTVKVDPQTSVNSDGTINITYHVSEGEKIYISKIIIKGNTKTRDHVIRREIPLHEGDAYNKALITASENNLRNLEFFKTVDIQPLQDPSSPDKCAVQVSVEETSTAEAMASASYSTTDGIGVELSYNEKNFFGTGRSLDVFLGSSRAKVGKSREIIDGVSRKVARKEKFRFLNNVQISSTDPHLFDKDMEGSIGFYRYVSGQWDSVDIKELGANLGVSYELCPGINQGWTLESARRRFDDVQDGASPLIRYQTLKFDETGSKILKEDKHNIVSLKHVISYAKFFMAPIRFRFNASLATTIAGLGGDARHLKNELTGSFMVPVTQKSHMNLSLSTGLLTKIGGRDPHMIDSFQLGLERFRGFEHSGMGPFSATLYEGNTADGKTIQYQRRDFIGGKKYWKGTAEYIFPLGLPEELMVRGFVFSDFGTLWDAPFKGKNDRCLKYTGATIEEPKTKEVFDACSCAFDTRVKGHKILDRKKVRVSVGFGISLVTPFGPIKLTYAMPVRKEKYDEPYKFLIGFSTVF